MGFDLVIAARLDVFAVQEDIDGTNLASVDRAPM
jgi:hypothetical protein